MLVYVICGMLNDVRGGDALVVGGGGGSVVLSKCRVWSEKEKKKSIESGG